MFQLPELILASASPRRQELLKSAGIIFTVKPSGVDEARINEESPKAHVQRLALLKASEVAIGNGKSWALAADTVVVIDGLILGKPKDQGHAKSMIFRLSGVTHTVLTGFCLRHHGLDKNYSDIVETKVTFRNISVPEIDWYVATGEPFDKAGAYAAQGKAMSFIRCVEGSYTNVVGLPLAEVLEMFAAALADLQ
ncbi:MAG: Maf family protein [Pseudomonadota bacterium]